MKGEIISVGTEILLGDILNTNTKFLSESLAKHGINVFYHTSVGDNGDRIAKVFQMAYKRSELILITGGLGPTKDDLTKEIIAKTLGLPLTLSLKWYHEMKGKFLKRAVKMPRNNIKQALLPKGATIIPNENGTACGIYIQNEGRHIFLLPGPPRELEPMFENWVSRKLKSFSHNELKSTVIKTFNIGESKLVEIIDDLIENQTDPTIAPLAKRDGVHLRVTTRDNLTGLKKTTKEIENRIGQYIWGYDEQELNTFVVEKMIANNLTLSLVESCSGGHIASSITDVSGSSKVLNQSQVLYTSLSKAEFLNCHIEEIPKDGIDYNLTQKLALESLSKCKTDISLAITGALGPTAPEGVEVGEVYISVANKGNVQTTKFNFYGSRESIKERCVITALHQLRILLGEMCNEG